MADNNPPLDDDAQDDQTLAEGQSLVPPLPQDNDTPFSPPTDPIQDPAEAVDVRTQQGRLDPTHPATDSATDIDSQQLYDEDLAGAAEQSEPNAGNSVAKYDPSEDQHQQLDDDATETKQA